MAVDAASSTERDKTASESTKPIREETERVLEQVVQKGEDSRCAGSGLRVSPEDSVTRVVESTGESPQGSRGDVVTNQSAGSRKRLFEGEGDDNRIPGEKSVASHAGGEGTVKKAKLEEGPDKLKSTSARETILSKCYSENSEDVSETGGLIMEVDTDTDSNNLVIDLDDNDVVLTPRKPSACTGFPGDAGERSPFVRKEGSCENVEMSTPPRDKSIDITTKSFKATDEITSIATLSSLGVQGTRRLNSCAKRGNGRPRSAVSRNGSVVSATKTWRPPKVYEMPATTLENVSSVSLHAASTVASVSSMLVTAPSALTAPTAVATPPVRSTLTASSQIGNVRPTLVSATPTVVTVKGIDGSNQFVKVMSFG